MSDLQKSLRETARRLLEEGTVSYVIGWGETRFPGKMQPRFAMKPEDADQLVYNEYCLNTLAKYLLDDRYPNGKIGLCVRGCESRAVNRLLKQFRDSQKMMKIVKKTGGKGLSGLFH